MDQSGMARKRVSTKTFSCSGDSVQRTKATVFQNERPRNGLGSTIVIRDQDLHDEMLREPAVRVMAEQLKDTMSHIEKR
jgi:hypothetical protein